MLQRSRAFRFVASAVLVFGLMLSSASAATPAGERVACTKDLMSCYWRAAALLDWFDRFVAALDCEIEYAGCVRRAIVAA